MRNAKEALRADVYHWFARCGFNKDRVVRNVESWGNWGFSFAEQDEAKAAVLAELKDPQYVAPKSIY
ncbi:TPA: hypothetical protein OMU21_004963 [Klebsiella aerogenes]|nr:hypothetical protein [Klebsiella aerogenes]